MRKKAKKVGRVRSIEFSGSEESTTASDYLPVHPPPLLSLKPPKVEPIDASDVDVKEALRSSLNQKVKLKPVGTPSDEESSITSIKVNVIAELSSPNTDDEGAGDFDRALQSSSSSKNARDDDEEIVAIRRERNRLAAQRCRQRRRDRIEKLEKIVAKLEGDGSSLEMEISELEGELVKLRRILHSHHCVARRPERTVFEAVRTENEDVRRGAR